MPEEVTCPRCNVRIPADMPACPFCRQPAVSPAPGGPEGAPGGAPEGTDIRDLLVPPESFPALKEFLRLYGKWLKLAVPVLIAIPALWIVFLLVTGLPVDIPEDPAFPIGVEKVKKGGRVALLKGTLTNLGESVPDLSLRSIGVTAEILMKDGRVERKRVFPRSPFRGEGALLHGESGAFEIEVPPGAKSVVLRVGIVDLGEGRRFKLPLQGDRPAGRK